MLDAITASQVALIEDQIRFQSINQNITNMQTPGYKSQRIESSGFDEQVLANLTSVSEHMPIASQYIQGSIEQSRRPNELALSGDGFFTVQTDEGIFYTRRGDFHVNQSGELVTVTGAKLLGKTGVIRVDDNPFTVDVSGNIYIDHHLVDQLSIANFAHPEALNYRGQGLYESLESPEASISNSTRILQGYLEQSNVKSVDEMMEMVKTSRHFEASQRVMRTADSLLSTAINQLGETNV